MEEKRKKFGMEILPSLHKRIKATALEHDIPLWAATQEAIENYLRSIHPEADDERCSTPIVNKRKEQDAFEVHSQDSQVLEVTPGEWKWVVRFLNILRSGTIAARAITWNVLTFGKGLGGGDDPHQSHPVARQRPSQKDFDRIYEETRAIEQTLDAEEAARREREHRGKGSSGIKS